MHVIHRHKHAYIVSIMHNTCTAHPVFHKSHTHHHTHTHAQCSWLTVKGLRLKITANYFVSTVARLPGSPEVAVIDLSNPSFQRVILSPLLLSGVCQRDQGATQKILAAKSKLTSGQNSTAVMNTVTLPATALVLISQMSTSSAHNNEYLMHLSWFETFHSLYRFKGPAWFIMCVEHLLRGGSNCWLDLI